MTNGQLVLDSMPWNARSHGSRSEASRASTKLARCALEMPGMCDWKCLGLLDHVGPSNFFSPVLRRFFCHKATNNRIEMAKDRNPKYAMHRGKV